LASGEYGKEVMRSSKATGHGDAGAVTVFGKETEGTATVKGWKNGFELCVLSLQLPKKLFIGDCESLAGQNGKITKNSLNYNKK
jgi:hypothetical protein